MKSLLSVLLFLLLIPALSVPALAEEVTVLYTGGIRGQLYAVTTCAETMESHGGLPRLSTMVGAMRPLFVNPVVLIDGGNFVPDTRNDVEFKTEVTMSALKVMGYDAVGVGTSDLRFNADKLKRYYDNYAMPMMSSNLVEKEGGAFYGKPYILVTSGSLTLAVLSIVPEDALSRYGKSSFNKTLDVIPPKTAVSDLLEELKGKADITILFTDLGMKETRELVSGLPGLDIAISSETVQDGRDVDLELDPPYVFPMGLGAMSLGRLTLRLDANSDVTVTEHELIALDDVVPTDEAMNSLIYEAYQERARQEGEEERLREIVEFGDENENIKELQKLSPMEYFNKISQETDE